MDTEFFVGLLQNIALLLASGVVFDHYWKQSEASLTLSKKLQIGILLSVVGIIVMLTPWKLSEGLVFDGRSILLSNAGLFFGPVPTLVAMLATGIFRLLAGGDGMWMGIMVIVSSGSIGILWHHFRKGWQEGKNRHWELILMGLVVHLVMLGFTPLLPETVAFSTLQRIYLPTLTIYPIGSFLFGFFLLHRLKHWQTKALLKANEERFRLFYENAPVAYHSLNKQGRILEVNQSWLQMLGYQKHEVMGRWIGDFLHPDSIAFWHEKFAEFLQIGRADNLDFTFMTKQGQEVKAITYGRISYDAKGDFLQTDSVVHNITERKNAENSIAKLNERLTLAAKAARFGVWDWDIVNDHLDWDDTMYDIYGLKPSDFQGAYDAWLSAVHPDDMLRSNEVSLKAREEGSEYDTEFRIRATDGTERLIRALGLVIRDAKGSAVRMTGINYDITQRRRDEEKLRDTLHQLEVITSNIPNILWKADVAPDGSFVNTYISPVVDEFLKLPANTINHNWENYFRYIVPDHLPEVMEKFRYGLANQGETISMEYEVNLADGTLAWFLSSGRAYTSENATHIFGYTTNITHRKQTEQRIAENERLLRGYFEGAPDAIFVYDRKGRFSLTNRSAGLLTGYSAQELQGMHVNDILTVPSMETAKKMMNDIAQSPGVSGEIEIVTKTGIAIPALVSAIRVEDDKILAFVKDITTIRNTRTELVKAKEKAEESNRLKSAFLATMSHELRTPLNAVIGFSALIGGEPDLQSIYDYAALINRSGNQLLSVIESVFEMAMLQSGKNKLIRSRFTVQDLLKDLEKIVLVDRHNKEKNHVDLRVNHQPDHSQTILYTDRHKLMQVLSNLTGNALKFTNEGSVEISCSLEHPDILFCVKDTGIGIPADKHSIVFEQFRQADDSHTRLYGGVGLGLSICNELARLLGGQITLESEPGKGSTFCFRLHNALAAPLAEETESRSAKKSIRFDKKTFLLVDDLDDNLFLLELMLKPTGASLLKAASGTTALELAGSHPEIDLVLMDIKMPGMDGYEAISLIHHHRPSLPVIAQTAYAVPGDKELALQKGCAGYVAKPIRKEVLLNEIRRALSMA